MHHHKILFAPFLIGVEETRNFFSHLHKPVLWFPTHQKIYRFNVPHFGPFSTLMSPKRWIAEFFVLCRHHSSQFPRILIFGRSSPTFNVFSVQIRRLLLPKSRFGEGKCNSIIYIPSPILAIQPDPLQTYLYCFTEHWKHSRAYKEVVQNNLGNFAKGDDKHGRRQRSIYRSESVIQRFYC